MFRALQDVAISFLVFGFLFGSVWGCGFTTHSLIANRALEYFYKPEYPGYDVLMKKSLNSMIAGAPFPDYLYTCGTDHDAGEAAHWPPFHAAAANFIRSQSKPWNDEVSSFVSFMLGVVSHYLADLSWHGLGSTIPHGYGMIQTLGIHDFQCNGDLCSAAHDAADTGGEFIAAFNTDLDWFHPEKWQIQADILVQIFHSINHTSVTVNTLNGCRLEFIAGALAIKYASEIIYSLETDKSPFLVESYLQHPLGGIDDMSVWTTRMWDRFITWIEQGPPNPPPPTLTHARPLLSARLHKFIKTYAPIVMQSPVFDAIRMGNYDDAHVDELREHLARHLNKSLSRDRSEPSKRYPQVPIGVPTNEHLEVVEVSSTSRVIQESTNALEYLGDSVISGDVDDDGVNDVIMGAWGASVLGSPQHGAVYVHLSSTNRTIMLNGYQYAGVFSRFGHSLQVVDMNIDGVVDLVVGAPTSGWNWTQTSQSADFKYHGSVYVFYGSRLFAETAVKSPDLIFASDIDFHNFGHVLSSGDVNGDGCADLICGSPYAHGPHPHEDPHSGIQRGIVHIFYAQKRTSTTPVTTPVMEADVTIYSPSDFQFFGNSMAVNKEILLIGAYGYRNNKSESVGRIYGYALPLKNSSITESTFTFTGDTRSSKYGYSMSLGSLNGRSVLVASMPSINTAASRAGQVVIYHNITSNMKGDYLWNHCELVYQIIESTDYESRFGMNVLLNDLNMDGYDDLVVSAPLKMAPFSLSSTQHELGSVYAFDGAQIAHDWRVNSKHESSEAVWSMMAQSALGRFGNAVCVLEEKNSKHGTQQKTLIVGQPRASGGEKQDIEMAGKVWAIELDF